MRVVLLAHASYSADPNLSDAVEARRTCSDEHGEQKLKPAQRKHPGAREVAGAVVRPRLRLDIHDHAERESRAVRSGPPGKAFRRAKPGARSPPSC